MALGIVSHPSGFHLNDTEWQSIRDHFPHRILPGLAGPFEHRVRFISGPIRALRAQAADDPARVIHTRREKDCVVATSKCIHIERIFDSVLAVVMTGTPDVVHPQIAFDRRMCEYYVAFCDGIPTAWSPLQPDQVGGGGLSLGNGHTCPFLGQPAKNDVEAGCQRSVSRHG
jgi:hypothetical protein